MCDFTKKNIPPAREKCDITPLYHKEIVINPLVLTQNGIRVEKFVQQAGKIFAFSTETDL
jgi:hypothetical protein